MNDFSLALYQSLPPALRSACATVHGFKLRHWRYGPETEELVRAALEREHWSQERWKVWQEERLAYVLHRAATRVPYYRDQWTLRRQKGDRNSWEILANWSILEKSELRQNAKAFLADDSESGRMLYLHTSGTTGTPLSLWFSRDTVRKWFALFEARWRRWCGVSRHERWAMLSGQLVAAVNQTKPPFWAWNAALHQLYMSSYHLSPKLIPYYLEALRKYRVQYLFGYSSSVYALAHEALRSNLPKLPMRVAITNAEPLFRHQREVIEEAFDCPVRETYGNTETVSAASECEFGRLHLWPEVGCTEVLENDQLLPNGTPGDLVCTGLLNADMPLIRYRLGDRGAVDPDTSICLCGRSLPTLASLEGRTDDLLYTADGRIVGRLDPVFKGKLPIHGAQIIQERLDRLRVRYVPTPAFTPEAGRSIVDRLQDRMGRVEVVLEAVEELPRDSRGKFRAVICNLPLHERKVRNKSDAPSTAA
jgi:phenylacetate-CoA ligase